MKRIPAVTRRSFIGSVLSAASVPMIVPASVFGQPAPSERIGIGVIGTGKMAHDYHLSTLSGFPDVEIRAVCDVDSTRRQHAKKYVDDKSGKGPCDAVIDYRQILERKDIQAVVIATPDHWHTLPVIEACLAGKDVYCEKPLTLTIREAELCIQAVRKHNRVLQTGSQQRSSVFGQFRLACELVRSGRIGKVKTVRVGVGGPSVWCDLAEEPAEPGLDWDRWLGPAPKRPYNSTLSPRGMHNHFPAWRNYREYSGGAVTDIGAHHFDIAQWALGMDDSGPIEIIPPEDSKATTGAKFIYANGVEMFHGGRSGCTFEGTDGTLSVDRGRLSSMPNTIVKEPLGEKDVHLYKSPGHHRDWIDCIRSRKRPVADVEIGARSVTVCHLANLAYWHRRKLRWNPAKWQFINDVQANTWLDYSRRAPWHLPKV